MKTLQLERGFAGGVPLAEYKPSFIACFVLSAPDSLMEHLHLSCTFLRCAGQPGHTV